MSVSGGTGSGEWIDAPITSAGPVWKAVVVRLAADLGVVKPVRRVCPVLRGWGGIAVGDAKRNWAPLCDVLANVATLRFLMRVLMFITHPCGVIESVAPDEILRAIH